jgi:ribosomal protein S18 acetylase RimI-like enzyme
MGDAEVVVREATPDDADAVAHVLAAAFEHYPWTRWTVDDRDHLARLVGLQRLAFTDLVMPFGEAWVAEERGEIVSAAMWMRPDKPVPEDVWHALSPLQARLEGNRRSASLAAEAALEPYRSAEPHYFLGAVGTDPCHQRRGLATAVLAPVLQRGGVARLETCGTANVGFYERLGFSVQHEVALPDGAPTVWVMQRA